MFHKRAKPALPPCPLPLPTYPPTPQTTLLKFVYFEQKGESLTNYNLVAIRKVSMDRPAMTTRRRARHRRLISHRRLIFVAADKVGITSCFLSSDFLGFFHCGFAASLGRACIAVAPALGDAKTLPGMMIMTFYHGVRDNRREWEAIYSYCA